MFLCWYDLRFSLTRDLILTEFSLIWQCRVQTILETRKLYMYAYYIYAVQVNL